jgi:transcriptional regulator with XRE-family HTH domain
MISLSQFLKYQRQFKGLSLSQMADYLGISHRTYQKIEHEEPVRVSVLKSVLDRTRFDAWDPFSLKENNKTLDTFFRHILYAQYQDAETTAKELLKHEESYLNSPLIIPYVLYMWFYVIHTQNPLIDVDLYLKHLEYLTEAMDDFDHELYAVEKTGYYFIKGELKQSFEHFQTILPTITDNHLKAMNYFLVGASGVNEIKSLDQSIEYLTLSHTIFNEYGNYLRANRCKAFLQIAYLHARRYDDFLSLYAQKEQYLKHNEEVARMDAFIEGNLGRYYVMTKNYPKALEVLRAITFPLSTNIFLHLVAAYQMGHPDLDQLLNDLSIEPQLLNAHHRLFYQTLKAYQTHQKVLPFMEGLKKAVMMSEKANDYIAYISINPILVDVLKAHKKYKEAYQWVSQELDILRQYH